MKQRMMAGTMQHVNFTSTLLVRKHYYQNVKIVKQGIFDFKAKLSFNRMMEYPFRKSNLLKLEGFKLFSIFEIDTKL